MFEHSSTKGSASEQDWLKLFQAYLPRRFRAEPAFVINAHGRISRQIDIVIFDALRSPPLFPHESSIYVPVESVYAAVEVKTRLTLREIDDAEEKVASVRCLRDDLDRDILGIALATDTWAERLFAKSLRRSLGRRSKLYRLDLGCALNRAAFENRDKVTISEPDEALIFFLLRLLDRLEELGQAPAVDLMRYVKNLKSFRD